jgi:hypothetical protein
MKTSSALTSTTEPPTSYTTEKRPRLSTHHYASFVVSTAVIMQSIRSRSGLTVAEQWSILDTVFY